MDEYSFDFNPKDCNKVYFDELFLLLNAINPEEENFKRIKKNQYQILNVKTNLICVNQTTFFLKIKNKLF